jgi:hypothetical protein
LPRAHSQVNPQQEAAAASSKKNALQSVARSPLATSEWRSPTDRPPFVPPPNYEEHRNISGELPSIAARQDTKA